ncbi:MAG: DeoR family transcriptional regulator [Anaerolineae bacterium]|nr:DeoR family transcriptional regulator [Anaerolineae bacterium]NIN95583.1 DeoR family transcriptional regulator [Anaerolineae bacterium]NIQ79204.1 DeoR family transcriptional regulator [Anaerolineae bacterium]
MIPEERRQQILHLIQTQGSVSVADLCIRFDVSEMTVRRDLADLERAGLLRRVYGGAVNAQGRSYEPPFLTRAGKHQAEKERIGQAAATFINNGDSLALDVGTTTLEIARHLEGKQNLTIVTPSLHIAKVLANQPSMRLMLTGGILRPSELSLIGHLAEKAFREFYVDKLFLGIGGIDFKAGLTEFNLEDALVKRAMLASAKECLVVADASKFGNIAFAAVAPLSAVHKIVTDSAVGSGIVSRLEEMNIEVILA